MTLRDLITQSPEASDATIADAFNARPEAWQRVESNAFLAWLGGGGRLAKLEGFVAATAESNDGPTIALRSAVRVALTGANNPTVYLSLDPSSEHRTLLGYLVSFGVLTQGDADVLVARAQARTPKTAEDVAAERQAIADEAERHARDARASNLANWIMGQADVPTGEQIAARWEESV